MAAAAAGMVVAARSEAVQAVVAPGAVEQSAAAVAQVVLGAMLAVAAPTATAEIAAEPCRSHELTVLQTMSW